MKERDAKIKLRHAKKLIIKLITFLHVPNEEMHWVKIFNFGEGATVKIGHLTFNI